MERLYARMVATLDGSALSERVLPHVTVMATRFDAAVTLLRVVEPISAVTKIVDAAASGASGNPLIAPRPRQTEADLGDDAAAYLEAIAQDLRQHGVRVHVRVKTGNAADLIAHEAQQAGADLILMASHGRGGIARAVLGSVAEAVVRDAPCPVLLIPAKE